MTRPAWALLLGDLMNTKIGGLAFSPEKVHVHVHVMRVHFIGMHVHLHRTL